MTSNYEFQSYSASSSSGGAGGVDANGLFAQVDANKDGSIDRNEFQSWIGSSLGAGQAGGAGAGFGSSSYESSSFSSSTGGVAGAEAGLAGGSFESASFSANGALDAGLAGGSSSFQSSSFESSSTGAAAGGFDATTVNQAASYTAETNAAWSKYGAEVRGAGLYVDANPQIIRRQAPGGVQTYTQNIKVRFLQPPPIPPPGVSAQDDEFMQFTIIFHFSHSSSKKCAHLNPLHHHLFASNNKLHLSHNLPHSSSVKNHHSHQRQLPHKLSFVNSLLYQFHHDQSSSNVSQLLQLAHVCSFTSLSIFRITLILKSNR